MEFYYTIAPWMMGCSAIILTIIVFVFVLMFIWSKCNQFIIKLFVKEEKTDGKKLAKKSINPFQYIMDIENDKHLYREISTDIVYIITYTFHGGTSVNYLVDIEGKPLLYKNWKEKIEQLENENL